VNFTVVNFIEAQRESLPITCMYRCELNTCSRVLLGKGMVALIVKFTAFMEPGCSFLC